MLCPHFLPVTLKPPAGRVQQASSFYAEMAGIKREKKKIKKKNLFGNKFISPAGRMTQRSQDQGNWQATVCMYRDSLVESKQQSAGFIKHQSTTAVYQADSHT